MTVLEKKNSTSSGKSEIKATLCYFISNICTKAFGFITIPLYTKILTTSEYGYLNTYNAWVSLLSVVLGLSLSSAILGKSKLEKKERDRFQSSTISLSLLSMLIMSTVVISVYVIVNGCIDVMVLLALIQGYGSFVINFMLQEWVVDNKYIVHSIVSVGSAAVPIGITCLIIKSVFQSQKYLCVIVPRASITVLLTIFFSVIILLRGRICFDKKNWIWCLKYCVPIVFHTLSLAIMLQADRIMLSSIRGYDESGVYSFIYNVTLVIGVLIAALENTWKTWFFKNYESVEKMSIQRRCRLFIIVAILGISVYIFIAPDLVKILAAEEYHAQIFLVAPIAFAYLISFLYDFLVYVEYKKDATKSIAKASIIAALTNIVLNFFIIPKFGGIGAACTTCVSYATQFILHILVVNNLHKGLYPIKFFLPFITMGIAIMVLFLFTFNLTVVRYVLVIVAIIVMLSIVYKKRTILV